MSFTSPVFLLFFFVVLTLYRLFPPPKRWLVLLPASYVFYAFHNPWLLSLIFLTTLVSYACARGMEHASVHRKRRLAVLAAAVCLMLLFVFKYLNFALSGVAGLARLLGMEASFGGFSLLLPMGISFYVFQTLSYTLDVYRGTAPAEHHLGYYALYVVFFPQLVAGPIERPDALLPQLKASPTPDATQLTEGVQLLVRGYAKKVMLADTLAPFVNAAYADPVQAGGAALVAATLLFALQIYCDFSGYSDIALGCARLMGIRLTENFHRPYAAVSVRDFWRRWHITLTRWFTDYVYIPLGGSRRGRGRQCVNILVVFLLSGLWHGANVTFLVWGGLHGLYLMGETLLLGKRAPKHQRLSRLVTLTLVCFAWVFFRAESLPQALLVLQTMVCDFRPEQLLIGLSMTVSQLLPVLLLTALLPALERLPALSVSGRNRSVMLAYFLLITALTLCRCMALTSGGDTAFLYFQF